MEKKSREELIQACKEKGIKGYSTKKKNELLEILKTAAVPAPAPVAAIVAAPLEKICRLNYIGSKFQLLEWITSIIQEKTGWKDFKRKTIADLFAGTGVVSHHFRMLGARVLSNDVELYGSIITYAFTRSTYTDNCKEQIRILEQELEEKRHEDTVGFVTRHYSPFESSERMFFTVENAKRIDYLRARLEEMQANLTPDEYNFLLASILLSADAISNVPAVYGCYLKNFKTKSQKNLHLVPIHTIQTEPLPGSRTHHSDVLELTKQVEADVVYLDPPYNERQYSKNYFPLNIIAKTPKQLESEPPLKGKTGIPTDCFLSPFCKKGETVEGAFEKLFRELKAKWIFLSYNSESLVSKEKMIELMQKFGTASVVERDYKRFKSFEYNEDKKIKEYLFCLERV